MYFYNTTFSVYRKRQLNDWHETLRVISAMVTRDALRLISIPFPVLTRGIMI